MFALEGDLSCPSECEKRGRLGIMSGWPLWLLGEVFPLLLYIVLGLLFWARLLLLDALIAGRSFTWTLRLLAAADLACSRL